MKPARLISPTIQRINARSSRGNLVYLHSAFAHTGSNRFKPVQNLTASAFCHRHTYIRHRSVVIPQSASERQRLHIVVFLLRHFQHLRSPSTCRTSSSNTRRFLPTAVSCPIRCIMFGGIYLVEGDKILVLGNLINRHLLH